MNTKQNLANGKTKQLTEETSFDKSPKQFVMTAIRECFKNDYIYIICVANYTLIVSRTENMFISPTVYILSLTILTFCCANINCSI